MFGISWAEFLVILIIAVAVIPARHWGDVAKFLARTIKFVRDLIWKISDSVNEIKDQIELEQPINDITSDAINDIKSAFATPIKKAKNVKQKSVIKSSKPNKSSGQKKSVTAKKPPVKGGKK